MIKTKEDLINFFNNIKIVISNSEVKLRKHNDKDSTWPDNGDILTIKFDDKKEKLLSVNLTRKIRSEENGSRKQLKNHFRFDISNSKFSVSKISEHFVFLCVENLKIPTNTEYNESNPFKLEIISQCNCGHNTRSKMKKVTFFLHEHNANDTTDLHGGTEDPVGGTGGGWTKQ
ncbi:hypothetical protein [Sessilibacter sp. MAH2]